MCVESMIHLPEVIGKWQFSVEGEVSLGWSDQEKWSELAHRAGRKK